MGDSLLLFMISGDSNYLSDCANIQSIMIMRIEGCFQVHDLKSKRK